MHPLRILIITPSFFPKRGGTQQVIHELVQAHNNENVEFVILTVQEEKQWPLYEHYGDTVIQRVSLSRVKGCKALILYIRMFFKALKIKRQFDFSIVHAFHIFEPAGALWLLKKILRIPVIITLAGWDTYDPDRKIPRRYMPFVRAAMNTADMVTAPSTHMAEAAYRQGCKKNIRVIPHGSGMHDKLASADADTVRKKHDVRDKRIVLSVQRLHPRKALEYVIYAVPDVLKIQNDVHFIIVGNGPEKHRLKKLAQQSSVHEHVTFAGFVPDTELASYYAAADIFVLPTLYEAFGLVYIDALCFGVPVVTTENGGANDIINESNGIIVPKKDSKGLANGIVQAFTTPWDRGIIKRQADKYRWSNIKSKYDGLYEKIAGQE